VSRPSFLARATSPASLVDTVRSASGAAVLLAPGKLFCSAPSLRGRCPASPVLRADPPPIAASRSLGLTASLPLLTFVRPRWASPVPSSIRVPACPALRPRQRLRRSRHGPRLLMPSRLGIRSAAASSPCRGSIASLALGPVGRSVYASPCSLPHTTQDSIAAGWLGLGGGRNCTSWMDEASLGALHRAV